MLVHICRINDAMSVLDVAATAAFFFFNLRSLTLFDGRVHITSICSDSKLFLSPFHRAISSHLFARSQTRVGIELSNNARNVRAHVLLRFGKSLV